ncbi:MAG: T9SS type A sorting domain-containing protein [Bacteroidota bacterium]
MKNIITIWTLLLSLSLLAQVNVSTLTPQFNGSGGLSLDADGNLYIADFGDFLDGPDLDGLPNDVLKLDTNLNLTTYSPGFLGASGNDFDSNGVLFQSDIRAGAIYKIVNGVRTFVTSTGISNPVGLAFDSNDNFYVCNCGNNTIRKVTPGGVSTQFASGNLFFCPNGIAIDEDDNLYVSNFSNGNIIKVSTNGSATLLNTTPGGSTSGPSNGHLDYDENTRMLYIASAGSNRIYSLPIDDPSNLQILAGTGVRGNDDGDATTATFSRPNGVAVSVTGDSIYVNSAIPITNNPNRPLNPSVVRLLKGVLSTLSVETITTSSFSNVKEYPNPAKSEFTIEADLNFEGAELTILFYDIRGSIVKELSKVDAAEGHLKVSVDVSDLNSGTYFYSLTDERGKKLFRKIIKD